MGSGQQNNDNQDDCQHPEQIGTLKRKREEGRFNRRRKRARGNLCSTFISFKNWPKSFLDSLGIS